MPDCPLDGVFFMPIFRVYNDTEADDGFRQKPSSRERVAARRADGCGKIRPTPVTCGDSPSQEGPFACG